MPIPPFADTARVEDIDVGLSGARVARLFDSSDRPVAVLKTVDTTRPDLVTELLGQEERLRWLRKRGLPVPCVLGSGARAGRRWLAMSHLDGRAAHEPWPAGDRHRVLGLLARALHGAPAEGCPFDMTPRVQLAEASARVASGLVDRSWAAAGREGPPAAEVFAGVAERARALGPGPTALIHGDYCLPNVLLDVHGTRGGREDGGNPGGWGFVDLGRAGLGDPHADLANMVASLRSPLNPQFGPEDAELFLDLYGREDIDPDRLRLWAEIDEFL
nr:aminoglycoside 3'-phosphotransferase [Nocardiopsis sp. TSRI0078]